MSCVEDLQEAVSLGRDVRCSVDDLCKSGQYLVNNSLVIVTQCW